MTSAYLDKEYDFVVNINTADTFIKVIECIDDMLPATIFPEKVAELWKTIIEISMMVTLIEQDELAYIQLSQVRDYLAKIGVLGLVTPDAIVWKVVNFIRALDGHNVSIIAEALSLMSDTSFEKCREDVYQYLNYTSKKVVVLIDSLDEYKLNAEVTGSIAGLLKCVGTFNSRQHCADIRLCIPAELYHVFSSASSNPAKDFSSEVLLHWHPRELIVLACRRFQLYLHLYYPYYYETYANRDYIQFDQSLGILEEFIPSEISNGLNFTERTIVYLLRHTQLLPRHLLLILNSVFRHKRYSTGRPKVNRDDIVKGVAASESLLTDEIFTSYKHVYRNAKRFMERCIPELPFRFEHSMLAEVFEKVVKDIYDDDIHAFTRMLIEIGILGKYIRSEGGYHEALFEYTVSNQLHFSLTDSFCIHPLFLNKFSAGYDASDHVTVYPYGTNPYTDEDYRLMF
ncbi:MAG: hypothetical protein AAF959_13405 [Cyanobacteria bacterium P01_D01_bin.56]